MYNISVIITPTNTGANIRPTLSTNNSWAERAQIIADCCCYTTVYNKLLLQSKLVVGVSLSTVYLNLNLHSNTIGAHVDE